MEHQRAGVLQAHRLLKFLADAKPDVLCCQEIKDECPLKVPGYLQFWNPAKRSNYSGTLVLARRQPLSCCYGLGIGIFDDEGRIITPEYKDYFIVNVYVPNLNPNSAPDRLDFRIEWDKTVREHFMKLPKSSIVCGDFNVARGYIDMYPKSRRTPRRNHCSSQRKGQALKHSFPLASLMSFVRSILRKRVPILGGGRAIKVARRTKAPGLIIFLFRGTSKLCPEHQALYRYDVF